MSLPVVYRRKVGRDLAAGFGYHEGQSEGLGERFLAAIDSAFDAIEHFPEIFARVHGDVRRAIVSRFPYAVFYRIESNWSIGRAPVGVDGAEEPPEGYTVPIARGRRPP